MNLPRLNGFFPDEDADGIMRDAPPKELVVNPERVSGYESLGTLDRLSWLRRAEAAVKFLCSLSYVGPFMAHLALIDSDGKGGLDCGCIWLSEPEE